MIPENVKALVMKYMNSDYHEPDEPLAIMESETIEEPYGWVFFYNTKKFTETNDVLHALGGNGPIVVLSKDNSLHSLGTARPFEEEMRAFEKEHGLSQ